MPRETAVQFEWDTQEWPESTSYSLCFSLDPEMKQTVAEHSVGVVNGKSSLTHEELQALLDKLSIKRWTSNSVYWNVKTDGWQMGVTFFRSTEYDRNDALHRCSWR